MKFQSKNMDLKGIMDHVLVQSCNFNLRYYTKSQNTVNNLSIPTEIDMIIKKNIQQKMPKQ